MNEDPWGDEELPSGHIADPAKGEYAMWASYLTNPAPTTWRQRLAKILRIWAVYLDGDISVSIRMLSIPPLPEEVHIRLLRAGLTGVGPAFHDAVAAEARDLAYKEMLRAGVDVSEYFTHARDALAPILKKP